MRTPSPIVERDCALTGYEKIKKEPAFQIQYKTSPVDIDALIAQACKDYKNRIVDHKAAQTLRSFNIEKPDDILSKYDFLKLLVVGYLKKVEDSPLGEVIDFLTELSHKYPQILLDENLQKSMRSFSENFLPLSGPLRQTLIDNEDNVILLAKTHPELISIGLIETVAEKLDEGIWYNRLDRHKQLKYLISHTRKNITPAIFESVLLSVIMDNDWRVREIATESFCAIKHRGIKKDNAYQMTLKLAESCRFANYEQKKRAHELLNDDIFKQQRIANSIDTDAPGKRKSRRPYTSFWEMGPK
ncbi:MAG: hypothetical protein PHE27_06165 [Alphaproteobacteria bacterium]|nr:hypothetical protein [Alphaproteobacteria bacterium]